MKKTLCILMVLGVISMMGCSQQQNQEVNTAETATISPYELSEKEEQILNLVATSPGDFLFYKVATKKSGLAAKIDHYQNGSLQNTVGEISSEILDDNAHVSFGSRVISMDTEEYRQWFISIEGASGTSLDDEPLGDSTITSLSSITEKKSLSQDEYSVVGVLIQNTNKSEMSTPSLDDDNALKNIIKENEDVYVFSCKIDK